MVSFLSLSFRNKVMLILLLFILVPFLITGYFAQKVTKSMVMHEKQEKLLALAHILDDRLEVGGFKALLEKHHGTDVSRQEQITLLNSLLRDDTNDIARSNGTYGVGFYSRALDAIITYGPSPEHDYAVGQSIAPDHPGRQVMQTATPLIRSGDMVRGDILNAMIPIMRQGECIGYIWVNELTTEVSAQLLEMATKIGLVMLLCFAIICTLVLILMQRTIRDLDTIIQGVGAIRRDFSSRIYVKSKELGEVARHINEMAEDIGKATTETERAISALQNVLSNVGAVVYVSDPQTKEIVYANDYLCHLVENNEIEGAKCHKILHGVEEPCSFCPEKKLFDSNGEPLFTPIHWEIHNDFLNRDFLVMDRLVRWHDGRLLHLEVATDITERKALAVAEAANLAQRDFLARMSHEIRTPMNGVLGMTHLAMQADPPPVQMEYLKKIQASASLLLGVINDILDFSRIEAGMLTMEKHPFIIRETLDNIRELIVPRVDASKVIFTVDCDETVPETVVGDELRFSQILLNLLGNAVKFTASGFIALQVRAEDLGSDEIRLFCSVSDSGIGITDEQRSSLFKPFAQADSSTSRKFGGTGLGLSICKTMIQLMAGSIHVESKPDEGSVFSFSVKLGKGEGSLVLSEEVPIAWETARYDDFSFLLVEDNAINQEIATAVLESFGASIDVVDNGKEGVEAFLKKDYSLILMDVRMPIMDGLEATRRIRASKKHDCLSVPIIAMTANAMMEDRIASREAGMNGHIAKPLDMTELKQILYTLLQTPSGCSTASWCTPTASNVDDENEGQAL